MAYTETILGLCLALTFSSIVQLIVCGLLGIVFSQFMNLLNTTVPTAAGVLAGLVTVPTVVQLRSSYTSMHFRDYGYTIWYKRLAMITCTSLQLIASILAIVYISKVADQRDFLDLMTTYGYNQEAKSTVDNIQWFLQCCGSSYFKDWYTINWGGYIFDTSLSRKKKSIVELLMDFDSDDYPDLTMMRRDAVPFSCCAEIATGACVHSNLRQLGTYTINCNGCVPKINDTKNSILWVELTIYAVTLLIQVVILMLLFRSRDAKNITDEKSHNPNREERTYSKFVNEGN